MARLDDPGMDGAYGYLIDPFPFRPYKIVFAFNPGHGLCCIKRFSERVCVLRPVFMLYPRPLVWMPCRDDTHKAVHLALKTVCSDKSLCKTWKGWVAEGRLGFYNKIFGAFAVAGKYAKPPAQETLIRCPFRHQPRVSSLHCLGRLCKPLPGHEVCRHIFRELIVILPCAGTKGRCYDFSQAVIFH